MCTLRFYAVGGTFFFGHTALGISTRLHILYLDEACDAEREM